MILLDTNVLSEPLKPEPAPAVIAWLDGQAVEYTVTAGQKGPQAQDVRAV